MPVADAIIGLPSIWGCTSVETVEATMPFAIFADEEELLEGDSSAPNCVQPCLWLDP